MLILDRKSFWNAVYRTRDCSMAGRRPEWLWGVNLTRCVSLVHFTAKTCYLSFCFEVCDITFRVQHFFLLCPHWMRFFSLLIFCPFFSLLLSFQLLFLLGLCFSFLLSKEFDGKSMFLGEKFISSPPESSASRSLCSWVRGFIYVKKNSKREYTE